MSWRIVLQPNGLFAKFSDCVDTFTIVDLSRADAIRLVENAAGKIVAKKKVEAAEKDPGRFLRDLATVEAVHGEAAAAEFLRRT